MKANYIREKLEKSMEAVAARIQEFVWHPGDLSRNRKLPPLTLFLCLMTAGGGAALTELQRLFRQLKDAPCASALTAARKELKPEAVKEIFWLCYEALCFQDGRPPVWQFIAVDGMHFTCADLNRRNSKFDDWRHKSKPCLEGSAVAAYDTRKMRFMDVVIQALHKMNECAAMCEITDRLKLHPDTKTCILADRGFPAWNVLWHAITRGIYFLIRTSNSAEGSSLLKQLQLPEKDKFDVTRKVRFVRLLSLMDEVIPGYTNVFLSRRIKFDGLPKGSHQDFRTEIRVVRHKADDGSRITVVTNLRTSQFNTRKIAQLYRERWTVENAFGRLKSALALESFHTNQPELMEQEVWGKMIAFNYVSAMRRAAARYAWKQDRARGARFKHRLEVDFSWACTCCLEYLNPESPCCYETDILETVSRKRHAVERKRDNPPTGRTKKEIPVPNDHPDDSDCRLYDNMSARR